MEISKFETCFLIYTTMKHIKIYEIHSPNLELNNEIKDHLSQFPYLGYSITDLDDGLEINFGKGIGIKYVKGILDPYHIKVINKNPLKLKLTGKKNVDRFEEFKGKTLIGNIENIDIDKLKIKALASKIDTGATTSSLHCEYIKINNDSNKVTFIPLDDSYDEYTGQKITLPLESTIRVQSSNGDHEARAMIKVDIELKGKTVETYFTLSNREELEYPVLIGKDILSGNFIVDASQINAK